MRWSTKPLKKRSVPGMLAILLGLVIPSVALAAPFSDRADLAFQIDADPGPRGSIPREVFFDGGGFPTPTPTATPTATPEPTATPVPLEQLFPTETPVIPYPPQNLGGLPGGAEARGLEADEASVQSPNLLLLSLPFAAAALILAFIVLRWVRRGRL